MPEYELAYWNLAGLAQGLRFLLKAAKIDYKAVDYTMEEGPKWFGEDKPKISELTSFPNLPYLKVGEDLVVTQSHAIFRYIGRNNKLNGKPGCEKALVNIDIVDGLLGDIWSAWAKMCFNKEKYAEEEFKKETHEKMLKNLKIFDDYLGKGNDFAAGSGNDNLSWVDFKALHMFNILMRWSKTYDSDLKNIKAYMNRVVEIGGIKDYFESENASRMIMPAMYCAWGSQVASELKFDM